MPRQVDMGGAFGRSNAGAEVPSVRKYRSAKSPRGSVGQAERHVLRRGDLRVSRGRPSPDGRGGVKNAGAGGSKTRSRCPRKGSPLRAPRGGGAASNRGDRSAGFNRISIRMPRGWIVVQPAPRAKRLAGTWDEKSNRLTSEPHDVMAKRAHSLREWGSRPAQLFALND